MEKLILLSLALCSTSNLLSQTSMGFENAYEEDWRSYDLPSLSTLIPNTSSSTPYDSDHIVNQVGGGHTGIKSYVFPTQLSDQPYRALIYYGLETNYGMNKKLSFWLYKASNVSMSLAVKVLDSYNDNIDPLSSFRITGGTGEYPFVEINTSTGNTWVKYEYTIPYYGNSMSNPEIIFYNPISNSPSWIDDIEFFDGSTSSIQEDFNSQFKVILNAEMSTLEVYPANGITEGYTVQIFNIEGKSISSQPLQTSLSLPKSLNKGIYLLSLEKDGKRWTKKIVL